MWRDGATHQRSGCGRLRRERVEVPFISSTPGDDRMFGRVRVGSRAPVILTRSRGLLLDPDHAAAYLFPRCRLRRECAINTPAESAW